MKLQVYEVVDKLKGLDRIIAGLRSDYIADAEEIDYEEVAYYLEEYRDTILSREVTF